MKITGTINTAIFILVLAFCCSLNMYAQTDSNATKAGRSAIFQRVLRIGAQTEQQDAETSQLAKPTRPRTRQNSVRMADFYLKDGKLIFGKLISEDKNKVIIEELSGSKIVVTAYSRREIDPRTLQTRNVPEYKYHMDLAEYFSGRTWDFRDDPDDFIQAIRCYEKAKQVVVGTSRIDTERIEQINERIKKLQADREVWAREIESRAKLKKLEFEAEIQTRLSELEDKISASSQKIDESVERLDNVIKEIKDNHQRLEQAFSMMEQDIRRQLNIMAGQIEANRRVIDPFYGYIRPRYPYGY
jgi:archaellum component FlaC